MMTTDESHRLRARRAINAARRGHLPKPKANIIVTATSTTTQNPNLPSTSSSISSNDYVFETARENSIEVYDDKFGRNSVLTRSARMRKFKFYQYKPIQDTPVTTTPRTTTRTTDSCNNQIQNHDSISLLSDSPQCPEPAVLLPRDEVVQGKVGLISEYQSEELSELDNQIVELEKKIADLNKNNGNNNVCNLDEIFNLVNKKNDLLRRQMQLNILEQEKILEKANEELTKELRSLISIDDSKKTKAELERQQYLYDQSLALVNRRNELVLHMDVQEKGIDEDNALKESLKSVINNKSNRRRLSSNGQDQNCCIQ